MNLLNIKAAGDSAVLIEFSHEITPETHTRVQALCHLLEPKSIKGIEEVVPAFCSLLVYYNPIEITYDKLHRKLTKLFRVSASINAPQKKTWKVPVCYGGIQGPDLPFVCSHTGLSEAEIISIHTSADYLIYMLGFLPGFPYLGGLDKRLETLPLKTPRTLIEAGSVGIGGNQTGIYPLPSPGRWQLIGKTPLKLYSPHKEQPVIYKAGDYIRFYPVNEREYSEILELEERGLYYQEALKGDH